MTLDTFLERLPELCQGNDDERDALVAALRAAVDNIPFHHLPRLEAALAEIANDHAH